MEMQSQVYAIVFDIGNVLLATSFQKTNKAMAELTGLSVEEVVKTFFKNPTARKIWRQSQMGKINLEKFCNEILSLLNVSGQNISHEELKQALTSSGSENPEIWELIETFAEINPKVKRAIISNNASLYRESGQKLMPRLGEFFSPENIFMSHKVGLMKPDPAIFTSTCKKLGVAIENIVLVDDNTENVEQFRKMGGVAIQYDCSKHYIVHLWTKLGNIGLL
ncbi:MAG: HAD-IA family hydrolase [Candidatus Magasanikbacteria bacterium]|nr:HAD-IA family hydrolase [Candidatus Magasanikbacteria bacterium]